MALIWADECDRPAGAPPDPTLWGVRRTDRWQPAAELQTYTADPANAHHDGNGHLVITAIRAADPRQPITSARLSARHATTRQLFRYGRFEARLSLPGAAGTWPAFWLLGEDDRVGWPDCGEIDIVEAPNSPSTAGQVHQGTHSPSLLDAGSVAVGVPPTSGDWRGFHTYAVDWQPGLVSFTVDDRPTGTVTRRAVEAAGGRWRFDDRHLSPVINLAVGGWAGPPDDWTEARMHVAWVRIWA
ncbi:glycoside hydrolase family 16 protein [Hamadaea sp. NPDC050747]|uniref:glycoside hydrolase family 16 protein n=1 Tax=Hamadaea sp. NPDC050747 TaxID=3155789 RepID=UPI0033EE3D0E